MLGVPDHPNNESNCQKLGMRCDCFKGNANSIHIMIISNITVHVNVMSRSLRIFIMMTLGCFFVGMEL